MIKNYLKIAFRNLLKHKVYALINALGLSIGIGSCLFILVISRHEYTYDQYHEKKDNIYRLIDRIRSSETRTVHTAASPAPWGPAMLRDYPEIEKCVRYLLRGHTLRKEDNPIAERFVYTDPDIFEVFSYKLISGDPATALENPYSLILTTPMAEKYFDGENPVGKTMLIDNKQEYLITGLMEKLPANSTFQFDFLSPFATLEKENFTAVEDWRSHWCHTYFLLSDDASIEAIEARFPQFMKTYIEEPFQQRYHPELQPLSEIHFSSQLSSNWGDDLEEVYIYIFSAIAFFILFIACINFMNLATARSANRAKEVGMRKVLGAFRLQLVRQFLTESIVISFIALFFAIVMVELALPWFNSLIEREEGVSIKYFEDNFYVLSLFGITLLVGIFAGSYPAFFLSKFKPVTVLTGKIVSGLRGMKLRKILVVSQFTIAIFMIIVNFILYNQVNYLNNKNLGFDKENIIYFSAPEDNTPERQRLIKHELRQNPAIRGVLMTSSEPGDGNMWGRFLPEASANQDGMTLRSIAIDEDYLPLLKIELVAGRNFSTERASDSTNALIINETAARQFGWDDPIGKTIQWMDAEVGSKSRTVIGVTKDFHFESLHEPVEPLMIHYSPKYLFRYLMKVEPTNMAETYEFLKEQWKVYDPNNPANHYFLDIDLERDYTMERIIGSLLLKFTFLTIFIAALGLLALASFTAEQRTKEIGVRKVLGASLKNIILMLSSEFVKLILIAFVIGGVLAYFAMDAWLRQFAYHIDIGPLTFLVCGLLILGITWLTIGYQAVKAALSNPVDSLRYE